MVTAERRCRTCQRTLPLGDRHFGALLRDATGQPRYYRRECKNCVRIRRGHRKRRGSRANERGDLRCYRCQRFLPPDHFYRIANPYKSHSSFCKACQRAVAKERYDERKAAAMRAVLAAPLGSAPEPLSRAIIPAGATAAACPGVDALPAPPPRSGESPAPAPRGRIPGRRAVD